MSTTAGMRPAPVGHGQRARERHVGAPPGKLTSTSAYGVGAGRGRRGRQRRVGIDGGQEHRLPQRLGLVGARQQQHQVGGAVTLGQTQVGDRTASTRWAPGTASSRARRPCCASRQARAGRSARAGAAVTATAGPPGPGPTGAPGGSGRPGGDAAGVDAHARPSPADRRHRCDAVGGFGRPAPARWPRATATGVWAVRRRPGRASDTAKDRWPRRRVKVVHPPNGTGRQPALEDAAEQEPHHEPDRDHEPGSEQPAGDGSIGRSPAARRARPCGSRGRPGGARVSARSSETRSQPPPRMRAPARTGTPSSRDRVAAQSPP